MSGTQCPDDGDPAIRYPFPVGARSTDGVIPHGRGADPEAVMARPALLAVVSVTVLTAGTAGAQGYTLSAYPYAADPESLYVIWTTSEPPGPDPYPAWVGYDVLRRAAGQGECEWANFVRVNDTIIPREVGQTHTRSFGERAPSTATLYEYRVLPVDANRQPAYPCCGFCAPCNVFVSSPASSAPIAVGVIEDWGWALYVNPCPGTCPGGYFEQGPVDELRPYAGTGTAFRLFGTIGCGTTEGCALNVDRWEITSCVTPTVPRTWGALKTIYR